MCIINVYNSSGRNNVSLLIMWSNSRVKIHLHFWKCGAPKLFCRAILLQRILSNIYLNKPIYCNTLIKIECGANYA